MNIHTHYTICLLIEGLSNEYSRHVPVLIEAVINFPVSRLQFNVYTFKLLQNTKFTF